MKDSEDREIEMMNSTKAKASILAHFSQGSKSCIRVQNLGKKCLYAFRHASGPITSALHRKNINLAIKVKVYHISVVIWYYR